MTECTALYVESNKNKNARGRAGTPGASYDRTRREQESQEDREARLDRQRLRTTINTWATLGTSASRVYKDDQMKEWISK